MKTFLGTENTLAGLQRPVRGLRHGFMVPGRNGFFSIFFFINLWTFLFWNKKKKKRNWCLTIKICLLRHPLISIFLLLPSETLRDYLFILSLPLVFFFLSPIFLCSAFDHPSSCCDWHFIRRVEVLSLDLYCNTVACSAFINLFLPACATQAGTNVTAAAHKLETSLLKTFQLSLPLLIGDFDLTPRHDVHFLEENKKIFKVFDIQML